MEMLRLASALVVVLPGSTSAVARADQEVTLSIVGTNDLHGRIEALALLSAHLGNLRSARARDGGAVLLVDAGDMWHGTLASNTGEGEAVVRAYNALGYVAAALGNHEFDFGPSEPAGATPGDPFGALAARAREARFPLLAANLSRADGAPLGWPNVRPSALIERAGIKVGIVGVTAAALLRTATTPASAPDGLRVSPPGPIIASEATRLRAAGARVIVLLAHEGGHCSRFDRPTDLSSCAPDGAILRIARDLPPGLVDVIVAGHTHGAIAHQVNGIAVIESYAEGRAFGRVDLTIGSAVTRRIFPPRFVCGSPEDPSSPRCRPGPYEGAALVADPAVVRIVADAVDAVRLRRDAPLGVVAAAPIRRGHLRESALGNLVADLLLAAHPGADLAITGDGGLREDLPRGPLRYGQLYQAFPFDNRAITLTMSAGELGRALRRQLQHGAAPPALAGVRVVVHCAGSRLFVDLYRGNGRPIAAAEPLTIATSDYLAPGRGGLFAHAAVSGGGTTLVRDAMAEALRARGGTIWPGDLYQRDRPRLVHPGRLPVRCPGPDARAQTSSGTSGFPRVGSFKQGGLQ
jgi:2',3'-cyclic-nucleotide 2'-phosphodiesterase (5'-nucleotidase family)